MTFPHVPDVTVTGSTAPTATNRHRRRTLFHEPRGRALRSTSSQCDCRLCCFQWALHDDDPGIDLAIRSDESPCTNPDHRCPQAEGNGHLRKGAVPAGDRDHRGCRTNDKGIAGFTEARWNDDVHPGVGRGGIRTWKNPHRCATRRLGSAASCTHDPHKATTDHDGAELSKGGANLLGDHFDRGWCVARSDDGDLDGHK